MTLENTSRQVNQHDIRNKHQPTNSIRAKSTPIIEHVA